MKKFFLRDFIFKCSPCVSKEIFKLNHFINATFSSSSSCQISLEITYNSSQSRQVNVYLFSSVNSNVFLFYIFSCICLSKRNEEKGQVELHYEIELNGCYISKIIFMRISIFHFSREFHIAW
jgi:hypothetical protein